MKKVVTTKEATKENAQRQINYIEKILQQAKDGEGVIRSINPNPIMGTSREKELVKVDVLDAKIGMNGPFGMKNAINQKSIDSINLEKPLRGRAYNQPTSGGNTTVPTAILNQSGMIQQLNQHSMDKMPSVIPQQQHFQAQPMSTKKHHSPAQLQEIYEYPQNISPVTMEMQEYTLGMAGMKNTSFGQNGGLPEGYAQRKSHGGSHGIINVTSEEKKQINLNSKQMLVTSQREIVNSVPRDPQQYTVQTAVEKVKGITKSGTEEVSSLTNRSNGGSNFNQPVASPANTFTLNNQIYYEQSANVGFQTIQPNAFHESKKLSSRNTQFLHSQLEAEHHQMQSSLNGLVGSSVRANPSSRTQQQQQNYEVVDEFLNQVRSRKSPPLNYPRYKHYSGLSPLNPIKVTKINTKLHEFELSGTLVGQNSHNQDLIDQVDYDGSFDVTKSKIQTLATAKARGLTEVMESNRSAAQQYSPKKHPKLKSLNYNYKFGFKEFDDLRQQAEPMEIKKIQQKYGVGVPVKNHDPLMLNARELEMLEARSARENMYSFLSPKYIQQKELESPRQTLPSSNLPVIKKVFHQQKLSLQEESYPYQSVQKRLNNIAKPRWKTPFNNTSRQENNAIQLSLQTEFEEQSRKYETFRVRDNFNKTQEIKGGFDKSKNGFNASRYPQSYRNVSQKDYPETTNSDFRKMRKNSHKLHGPKSKQFEYVKFNHFDEQPEQKAVNITHTSRLQLLEQIDNLKFGKNRDMELSSWAKRQTRNMQAPRPNAFRTSGFADDGTTQTANTSQRLDFPMEEFMATTPYDVSHSVVEQEIQKGEESPEANQNAPEETFNLNQKAIYGIQQKAQNIVKPKQSKNDLPSELPGTLNLEKMLLTEAQRAKGSQSPKLSSGPGQFAQHTLLHHRSSHGNTIEPPNPNILSKKDASAGMSNKSSLVPISSRQGGRSYSRVSPVHDQLILNFKREIATQRTSKSPISRKTPPMRSGERAAQSHMRPDENFYKTIEQLPQVPLSLKLKVQDQLRALQRRIRIKREQIDNMRMINLEQNEIFQENIAKQSKLQKVWDKCENPQTKFLHQAATSINTIMIPYDSHQLFKATFNTQRSTNPSGNQNSEVLQYAQTNQKLGSQFSSEMQQKAILNNNKSAGFTKKQKSRDSSLGAAEREAGGDAHHILDQDQSEELTQTPKFERHKSLDKGQIQKLAQIERRVLSLYKDTVHNDLLKEKSDARDIMTKMKMQNSLEAQEIQALKQENKTLNNIVNRYRSFVRDVGHSKAQRQKFQDYIGKKQNKKKVASYMDENQRRRVQTQNSNAIHIKMEDIHEVESTLHEHSHKEITIDDVGHSALETRKDSQPTEIKETHNSTKQVQEEQAKLDAKESESKLVEPKVDSILRKLEQDKKPEGLAKRRMSSFLSDNKSSYLEKVDVDKIMKFVHTTKNACKQEKALDMALNLIDTVKTFLGCQKVMLIPLDYLLGSIMTGKQFYSPEKLQCVYSIEYCDKADGEARKLAVIARSEDDMSKEFVMDTIKDRSEPEVVVKDNKVAILFRECKANGGPSFAIQAEYDSKNLKKNLTKMGSQKVSTMDAPGERRASTISVSQAQNSKRINVVEALILQALFQSVQVKFEKLMLIQKLRQSRNAKETTQNMIADIIKSRTLRGLMRTMNQVVMNYMQFTDINIMFHDTERDSLYTITFGDDEEAQHMVQQKLKEAETEKERQDILDKESMRDVTLRSNQMILYPLHMGITSQVFKTQKTYIMNNFRKDVNFVNEIDNPKGIKQINNILIGALKREDGSSVGVVQMFNNQNPILPYDRKKFEAIAKFFGAMVQNLELVTIKLTQIVAIEMVKADAKVAVEAGFQAVYEGTLKSYIEMRKPFDNMAQDLKKNYDCNAREDDSDFN